MHPGGQAHRPLRQLVQAPGTTCASPKQDLHTLARARAAQLSTEGHSIALEFIINPSDEDVLTTPVWQRSQHSTYEARPHITTHVDAVVEHLGNTLYEGGRAAPAGCDRDHMGEFVSTEGVRRDDGIRPSTPGRLDNRAVFSHTGLLDLVLPGFLVEGLVIALDEGVLSPSEGLKGQGRLPAGHYVPP